MSLEWSALLVLGAYHGLNPSMGWLFAVALVLAIKGTPGAGAFAVAAHVLSYFAVMSTVACVVYRKVGLQFFVPHGSTWTVSGQPPF